MANKPMQLFNAPRCGAHSRRTGQPCKNPAMRGKKRCRMHGGKAAGRPIIHGRETRAAKAARREAWLFWRSLKELLAEY